MKNLLYLTYDGLLDAVTQSQVLPYIKKISRKRFNITILSFEKIKKIKDKSASNIIKQELKECRVGWLLLKYHRSPFILATVFDILQGLFLGLWKIYTRKIHIIHSRGYIAALIGLFLKYATGRKLIFDMRGFWPDEKVDAGLWKQDGLLYIIFKNIERGLISRSNEVVVLTEAARKFLYRAFPSSSFSVIPCGTDGNLFKSSIHKDILPNEARGKFIIIYIGSLGTFYNLEDMVAFFKIVKNNNPNTFFWIVTNSSHNIAHKLMSVSHLDSLNYAVSTLSYKDVPNALVCADASIIFYRRRLSGIGCSPIKFAESLFCGVPVIINAGIGDTEELVRTNKIGVVVRKFNKESYEKAANELRQLLLVEPEKLRNRCRKAAETYFSLTDGVERYWQIYQRY